MEIIFLLGRIILGGFFIMSGLNHFLKFGMMKTYTASKGVPLPGESVAGTGVLLVLGGSSVLLGVYPKVGVVVLIFFLATAAFTMHRFWSVYDAPSRIADQVNFLKNLALAGALLMILAIPSPWPLSLFGS